MIGHHVARLIHIPGTLAANITVTLSMPQDCRLVRVSAVASNNSDATLMIGVSTDTDSIMAATAIGDSGTPVIFDPDDWATTNPTAHLDAGDILVLTLDFDGAAGTAAQNVTIDLDFLEG
jgi:hypothetical protein